MSARKHKGVRPTHNWDLLVPLEEWHEQERYAEEGMEGRFDAPASQTQEAAAGDSPPPTRDLKAEYPHFNLNEIANPRSAPASAGNRR